VVGKDIDSLKEQICNLETNLSINKEIIKNMIDNATSSNPN
jgi:hypothetical protein